MTAAVLSGECHRRRPLKVQAIALECQAAVVRIPSCCQRELVQLGSKGMGGCEDRIRLLHMVGIACCSIEHPLRLAAYLNYSGHPCRAAWLHGPAAQRPRRSFPAAQPAWAHKWRGEGLQ